MAVTITDTGRDSTSPIWVGRRGTGATTYDFKPGCSLTSPTPILPQAAAILDRAGLGGCAYTPTGNVRFVEILATPSMVFNAEIERFAYTSDCGGSGGDVISQGHAQLPIYSSLFPANSTAISGEVDLGSPAIDVSCISENQKYLRRVNLTLFNRGPAGDVPGEIVPSFGGPEGTVPANLHACGKRGSAGQPHDSAAVEGSARQQ